MGHAGSGRARRASPDYREIFEVEAGNADARSPEQ